MSQIDQLKKTLEIIILSGTVFEKSTRYSSLAGIQAFLVFNTVGIDGKVMYHFAAMCHGKQELVGVRLEGNMLVAMTNTRDPGSCFITVPEEGSVEQRIKGMRTGVLNYNWRLMNTILPNTLSTE